MSASTTSASGLARWAASASGEERGERHVVGGVEGHERHVHTLDHLLGSQRIDPHVYSATPLGVLPPASIAPAIATNSGTRDANPGSARSAYATFVSGPISQLVFKPERRGAERKRWDCSPPERAAVGTVYD